MPMGEPGKTGRHDGGRPASSLNRLLDDVARQLGCPSGDEERMYTLTDKRNSSIEQLVQFGQELEKDAPTQGADGPVSSLKDDGPPSSFGQRRRSSLSELTAFFQELIDDGDRNATKSAILPNENNDTEEDVKAVAGEPRHPYTMNDKMTTMPSTEQAMGRQAEGGGGGVGGRGDGEEGPDKGVQRGSVYLLMQAMNAVDAASDAANDDGVKNHARL